MSDSEELKLPAYNRFITSISSLALPLSGSEIHGVMCGYLCAGANHEGISYLHALIGNKSSRKLCGAEMVLFGLYSVSEHQINNFDFDFQLMLPDDSEPLVMRAEAFSKWCRGFIQGLKMAGIKIHQLDDEDSEEAFKHFKEFAALDYSELQVSEEDEKAFVEVSEYARMAVLRIYADLLDHNLKNKQDKITH